ncbi:hypothetical protein ENBRE01_2654, partial [Enteropsectra breve]
MEEQDASPDSDKKAIITEHNIDITTVNEVNNAVHNVNNVNNEDTNSIKANRFKDFSPHVDFNTPRINALLKILLATILLFSIPAILQILHFSFKSQSYLSLLKESAEQQPYGYENKNDNSANDRIEHQTNPKIIFKIIRGYAHKTILSRIHLSLFYIAVKTVQRRYVPSVYLPDSYYVRKTLRQSLVCMSFLQTVFFLGDIFRVFQTGAAGKPSRAFDEEYPISAAFASIVGENVNNVSNMNSVINEGNMIVSNMNDGKNKGNMNGNTSILAHRKTAVVLFAAASLLISLFLYFYEKSIPGFIFLLCISIGVLKEHISRCIELDLNTKDTAEASLYAIHRLSIAPFTAYFANMPLINAALKDSGCMAERVFAFNNTQKHKNIQSNYSVFSISSVHGPIVLMGRGLLDLFKNDQPVVAAIAAREKIFAESMGYAISTAVMASVTILFVVLLVRVFSLSKYKGIDKKNNRDENVSSNHINNANYKNDSSRKRFGLRALEILLALVIFKAICPVLGNILKRHLCHSADRNYIKNGDKNALLYYLRAYGCVAEQYYEKYYESD